jgi:hypothetical protein
MAETIVLKVATTAGLNAQALADSKSFVDRARQLDPDEANFADHVTTLLREVARDPRYGPAPAPLPAPEPQAAAEPQPEPELPPWVPVQPGELRQWTQEDYTYWTAPGRDPDGSVVVDAIHAGLLAGIGVGRARPSSSRRR